MAGGGSSRTSGGKKRARIEIIPLIDVIFFLLATFVLFTLSLNRSNGLSVSLPQSVTGEPSDPNGTVTVSITQEGTIGWNKEQITLDEFIKRLKVFHAQHPEADANILINGDKDAMFSQAVYVLDEARRAGIQRILIQTEVMPTGT